MRFVLVALALITWSSHDVSAQGNADAGRKLWASADSRCRDCHGGKGEGGFGPDLAGRQLTLDQFKVAVRTPWGIMPAFPEATHSDQELADFFAYLSALPKVASPASWRTAVPANAPMGQELLVATYGCGQCHGIAFGGPRADAGAVNADFEWFKRMTYEHTTAMPAHRQLVGEAPARVRMGNYSRTRLPEVLLQEMWRHVRDDLRFRAPLTSRLSAATPAGSYQVVVHNEGLAGKGLTAEDITIVLELAPGTTVNATGAGYQGVRMDPQLKAETAVWRVARLGPQQEQAITFGLAGGRIVRGQVRWTKPAQGSREPDQINVAMEATQTN